MRYLYDQRLALACRLLLGAIFIAAALGKIFDPHGFADEVAAFSILPLGMVNVFALAVPWVEIGAASLLLLNKMVVSAAIIIAGLNVMFIAAIAFAMSTNPDISCGCFTLFVKENSGISIRLIIRDAILLALCIPLIAPFISREPTSA